MIFTSFQVWEVIVPAHPELLQAPAPRGRMYRDCSTWDRLPIALVEGTLSSGIKVLAEGTRGLNSQQLRELLSSLVGRDLRSWHPGSALNAGSVPHLPGPYPPAGWELSAGCDGTALLEMLWLDAMGKTCGLPAHTFLGGAHREEVLVDFWANRPPAQTLAGLITRAREQNCPGMKLKCDAEGDTVEALWSLRHDLPEDFSFTIDPMAAWMNFTHSRSFFNHLAQLPCPVKVEDPFPPGSGEEWQRVRQAFPSLLLAWHTRSQAGLQQGLQIHVADSFNIGPQSQFEMVAASHALEPSGKPCWQGSGLELGVAQHWRLHGIAAARTCVLPCDLQSEWVRQSTCVQERLLTGQSTAKVPSRPGLGVTLDPAALEQFGAAHWSI